MQFIVRNDTDGVLVFDFDVRHFRNTDIRGRFSPFGGSTVINVHQVGQPSRLYVARCRSNERFSRRAGILVGLQKFLRAEGFGSFDAFYFPTSGRNAYEVYTTTADDNIPWLWFLDSSLVSRFGSNRGWYFTEIDYVEEESFGAIDPYDYTLDEEEVMA